jgi:hypothetical protein
LSYQLAHAAPADSSSGSGDGLINVLHPAFAYLYSPVFRSLTHTIDVYIDELTQIAIAQTETVMLVSMIGYAVGLLITSVIFYCVILPSRDRIKNMSIKTGQISSLSKALMGYVLEISEKKYDLLDVKEEVHGKKKGENDDDDDNEYNELDELDEIEFALIDKALKTD